MPEIRCQFCDRVYSTEKSGAAALADCPTANTHPGKGTRAVPGPPAIAENRAVPPPPGPVPKPDQPATGAFPDVEV